MAYTYKKEAADVNLSCELIGMAFSKANNKRRHKLDIVYYVSIETYNLTTLVAFPHCRDSEVSDAKGK